MILLTVAALAAEVERLRRLSSQVIGMAAELVRLPSELPDLIEREPVIEIVVRLRDAVDAARVADERPKEGGDAHG